MLVSYPSVVAAADVHGVTVAPCKGEPVYAENGDETRRVVLGVHVVECAINIKRCAQNL